MKNFFLTNFNILFFDKFKLPLATLKLQDTTIPEIKQKLIILKGGIKDIKKSNKTYKNTNYVANSTTGTGTYFFSGTGNEIRNRIRVLVHNIGTGTSNIKGCIWV